MNELSFFWHDYETFGRVPRRDRPAQFAGVRTDAELNEIGDPLMLYCQPADDVLPDPESCLLTGITPQLCQQRGVPEAQFAQRILSELSRPGTVGVGYNSIRFDDEVTRHLFWRNLIDPYAREWQNDCGRWDLLDVVRCAHALRPEGLEWPTHADGSTSFRLEDLTAANGLAHDSAHDALSDVRATIALARRLRTAQPRLWDFCLKLRRKDAVRAEIGSDRPFLHISGMYGADRGCLALVWPLAVHPANANEVIVWDLAHNPGELLSMGAADIRERLFIRTQDLPEGQSRLPIKTIHINKSPIVIGNLATLKAERAQHWGLDVAQSLVHAERLRQEGHLLSAMWPEVFERPPAAAADVDEDLYAGFVGANDRKRLDKLRALPPQQMVDAPAAFDDARLAELWFRYRARLVPPVLSEAETERWLQHRIDRLHHGLGGAQTLQSFFDRIDALSENADERGQDILAALYDFAESIAPPL